MNEEGFWAMVTKTESCWLWKAPHAVKSYGSVRWKGRQAHAHRVSWELANGPVPDGLQLDHLCRNRACVNPDHLEPVSRRENLIRGEGFPGRNVRKTECSMGHPYSGSNLRLDNKGKRVCRACRKVYQRRYIFGLYARRKAVSDG